MFTDEGTLLKAAVVHRSVNMALASQIVPLVDSGFGPPSRLKNTGLPWGWFGTRQGVVRQNR